MRRLSPESGLFLLGVALFAALLFKHISYPVLWQDEAETAVFAERVIDFGYPKVHGPRNVIYEFGGNIAVGVKESVDAYIGTTWGHFYFAVPGVLWAARASDRYEKTARVRIPFALAGAIGVGFWAWAFVPVFRGEPRRARLFAGLFFLMAGLSISFVLHLREARYYSLLVLLCGALACVEFRYRVFAEITAARRSVLSALLLVGVFHTFFAAYFVLAFALVLDALVARAHSGGGMRSLAIETAPVSLSALLVAPALVFFETFAIVDSFRANLGFSIGGFAENAMFFVRHFLRHEWLAPALVTRVAVSFVVAAAKRRGFGEIAVSERTVAARLTAFVGIYVVATCANPLVYERYFLPVVPAVIAIFLLDAFALFRMACAWGGEQSRALRVAVVAALGAVIVLTGDQRAEDLRGRITEISEPFHGPLDVAIDRIASRVADPASLVIATNYANHPFIYYLGSHVIVGTNLNNILAERSLAPDIVIPRYRWPRGLPELRAFLARGDFEREALPVRDTHFNNVPSLTVSRSTPDVHRFRSPATLSDGPDTRLEIFWRRSQGGSPAAAGEDRSEDRDVNPPGDDR